jgi:histidinol-phosphate aminotransferase
MDELPLRDDLRGQQPHSNKHLDAETLLNTNENPYAPSGGLADALGKAVSQAALDANRHPDRDAEALRADLAYYLTSDADFGLQGSQVWAANGSNEVLQHLCQAFGGPGRVALGFEPTCPIYRPIAMATGAGWVTRPGHDDFTIDADAAVDAVRQLRPSLVFMCSPDNPTGRVIPLDVVQAVCAAVEETGSGIVVVDEAYAEFRRAGVPSALTLLPEQPRLVVTRTMTTAFGLAGARVGYLAGAPAIVDALQLVSLPFHLSTFTQAVARTALAHADELLKTVELVKAQRDRLVTELGRLGCTVVPSDANFVLFGRFADSKAVWHSLFDAGILVRQVEIDGWLRVTAGLPTEVDSFLSTLGRILVETPPHS